MSQEIIDLDDDSVVSLDSMSFSDGVALDDSENFVYVEHELGSIENVRILLTDTGDLKHYEIREKEPFEKIFDQIAEFYNVDPSEVMIIRNNIPVSPKDSVESIKFSILDRFRAFVFKKTKEDIIKDLKEPSDDRIQVSFQRDNREKNRLHFYMTENDKFKVIYELISEELKIPESQIKIKFDDEIVLPDYSLKSMDVDEHVVMDLILPKK